MLEERPDAATLAFEKAIEHHRRGALSEALGFYRQVLDIDPAHPDANHNAGNILGQQGDFLRGIQYLKTAIASNPTQYQFWRSLALLLGKAGQRAELENLLELMKRNGASEAQLEEIRHNARVEAATPDTAGRRAQPKNKKSPWQGTSSITKKLRNKRRDKILSHCKTLFSAGRVEEAAQAAIDGLASHRDSSELWDVLGACLILLKQPREALEPLHTAVELDPHNSLAWDHLGLALNRIGEYGAAADCYTKSLRLAPKRSATLSNAAMNAQLRGLALEAESYALRALQSDPENPDALNNLGVALKDQGRTTEALDALNKAIALRPDFFEAYNNLGTTLRDIADYVGSVNAYRTCLSLQPDFQPARSNMLFSMHYASEFTPEEIFEETLEYGRRISQRATATQAHRAPRADDALHRVGFVSGDFGNHPVGYFIRNMIFSLKDHGIETFAYSNFKRNDDTTAILKAGFSHWRDIDAMSDDEVVELIRADKVDFLIDLSGHTAYNRLSIFAYRPAPVAATWLGYFASTGIAAIDYVICDPYVMPRGSEKHFSEAPLRMPASYLCFSPPPYDLPVSAPPCVASGTVTFGSFNNISKINNDVVAVWSRILASMPDSRLFLKYRQLADPSIRENLIRRFGAHGIGPERLLLEEASPRHELLASYARVDIALDPFPYTGGTTSAEALWMGVPVVTRKGNSFLSRMGESILTNAGLDDWVARDANDYVARACAFARDEPLLSGIRAQMRENLLESPLFDHRRFARDFAAMLREAWATKMITTREA